MGRAPCCDKQGLKKGPWTPDEDQKLVAYIQRHGHGSWRALPKHAGEGPICCVRCAFAAFWWCCGVCRGGSSVEADERSGRLRILPISP